MAGPPHPDPFPEARGSRAAARLEIACAAIADGAGRILIARRPLGVHLGGLWELPGGKVRPGETPEEAARRESREELGVEIEVLDPVCPPVDHDYPERRVRLRFYRARLAAGSPPARPLGCAEIAWVAPADLPRYDFPPANGAVVAALSPAR